MTQCSKTFYTQNIAKFIATLREVDINPSLREAMDAVQALHAVGLEERSYVKQALCATLIKNKAQTALFHDAFDAFFVSTDEMDENRYLQMLAQNRRQQRMEQSRNELVFQEQPLNLPDDLISTYTYMPEADKERIQDFLERTSTGKKVGPKFKELTENIVSGRLKAQNRAGGGGAGEDVESDQLLYKCISSITQEEVPRALVLIHYLVRQINAKLQRQYRRSTRRGALDIKASLHKSLNTGGNLFKLCFKRKPKRKQRLLLLYDVSGSMYRFSSFAVQFISGLYKAADKADGYIFSEGCEKLQTQALHSAQTFETALMQSNLWRKGTNLSQALDFLLMPKNYALSSSTVVLIFSDGKTLDSLAALEKLQKLSVATRKIIWMNPLSDDIWGDLRALKSFSKYCLMLDCSTLHNLATACTRSMSMFL